MPVVLSSPGVYIEEISSGVRSITGVATSVTAFVGRARRGPTDADGPVTVTSFTEFVRVFGTLWVDSPMTFAVRDFFLNGGSQAVIVRLYRRDPAKASDPTKSEILLPDGAAGKGWALTARSPGTWGNRLRARVDYDTRASVTGEGPNTLFNLYVRDDLTGLVEEFRNVSIEAHHARRVDRVLADQSTLVNGVEPKLRPTDHGKPTSTNPMWGDVIPVPPGTPTNTKVTKQVKDDGTALTSFEFIDSTLPAKQGLYALEHADLFNLLCIPPHVLDPEGGVGGVIETDLVNKAAAYCESRRAVLLVDPRWRTVNDAVQNGVDLAANAGTVSKNAALFFPRLRQPNSERDNQIEPFAPCGVVAGVISRTDAQRGVWKAPAGLDSALGRVP